MKIWNTLTKKRNECTIPELKQKQKFCQILSIMFAIEALAFVILSFVLYSYGLKITGLYAIALFIGYMVFFFLEIDERNTFYMGIFLKEKLGE